MTLRRLTVVFGGGLGSHPDVFARVQREVDVHGARPPALLLSVVGARAGIVGAVEVAASMVRFTWAPRRRRVTSASGGSGSCAEPFGIAPRRQPELPSIFAAELRRAVVADAVADCGNVVSPGEQQQTGLL